MSGGRETRDRIIVKNYPSDTSSRDLQIMFEKYGKIDDCKLMRQLYYHTRTCSTCNLVVMIMLMYACKAMDIKLIEDKVVYSHYNYSWNGEWILLSL